MIDQVDVIFPTRNRLNEVITTIKKLLDCEINQKQIFIGDDGSSIDIKNKIHSIYPNVTILKNEISQGQLVTRNRLFKVSKRPFILSLDDDSHILSSKDLVEAIKILKENPQVGIFAFQAHQSLSLPPLIDNSENQIQFVRTFIACGALIKRSCINSIGYYTREDLGYYGEELDCSIRAFKKGWKVVSKRGLWVHHRVDRDYKTMPKKSDLSKGIYGSDWRSMMGFSDSLIITGIYYPLLLDIIFTFYYIIKRFTGFTIKNKDFSAYISGLLRAINFSFYIMKEKSPMSYPQFIKWIRLPMM